MGEDNSKEEKARMKFEDRRMAFKEATSWGKALSIAWYESYGHSYYQHYTSLNRVVEKIVNQEWWLTRSDSVRLNDVQESRKFGNFGLLRRTYQASFVHGVRESAAMWGLYARGDPLAIRILIPKETMEKWVNELRLVDNPEKCGKIRLDDPRYVQFRDLVYASVPFVNAEWERDSLDEERGNGLFWTGERSGFGKNKARQKELLKNLRTEEVTGWLKDAEWEHECESRLCVRIQRVSPKVAIPVHLPSWVIARMNFTFSPWLDKDREGAIKDILRTLLDMNAKRKDMEGCKRLKKPFRRSVLQGALNFK